VSKSTRTGGAGAPGFGGGRLYMVGWSELRIGTDILDDKIT
jgi:hypothetical protein